MIFDNYGTKIAVDEPLVKGTLYPDPDALILAASVFDVPPGTWLSLPAELWGVNLPPQTLYTIGVGTLNYMSMIRLTGDFEATYWTTRESAEAALADLVKGIA